MIIQIVEDDKDYLKYVRERSDVPVLILTANDSEIINKKGQGVCTSLRQKEY